MIIPPPSPFLIQQGFDARVVPPCGTGSSGICVIAEAPGKHEAEDLIVLHPKADAGSVFAKVLRRCGVSRDSLTLSNIVWERPPGNALDECPYELEAVAYFRPANEALILERRPKVIILTGNVPLRAFTEFGREDGQMITQLEGYTVPATIAGHDTLLLFSLHPSFILHGQQARTQTLIWSLQRAFQLVREGLKPQPTRYVPTPNLEDMLAFERGFNPERDFLAFDIETPESGKLDEEEVEDKEEDISYQIIRASLCYDGEAGYSISIPWQAPFIEIYLRMLARAQRLEVYNAYFDVPRLKHAGANFNGRIYDRLKSWRFLQPTLPASLGFITPLLGWNLPPWKFKSQKEPETYSAIDTHALRFDGMQIEAALRSRGVFDLHERHVVGCFEVLEKMAENGLPFDQPAAKVFGEKLTVMREERERALQSRVPDELKPVKQKKGYKKVPKDLAGCVQRPFLVEWDDLTVLEQAQLSQQDKMNPQLGGTLLGGLAKCEVIRWAKLEEFNPDSPLQLLQLIRHYGYKVGTNRKTKKPTTDAETLRKLIHKCGLESKKERDQQFAETLKMCLECRQLGKVIGTYINGWQVGKDGRVHATPGIWGKMFRISWRKPNLSATIQDKTEGAIAAGFRKCVATAPHKILVESDWRGIEAKLVGYFAKDPDYMRLSSLGVHDYFCTHVLRIRGKFQPCDIPPLSLPDVELRRIFKEVKKRYPKDRDDAKHCTHGIAYGLGPNLMSSMYEIPQVEAEELIALFFETFPKVHQWQEWVKREASEKVWLQGPFYRMPFWEIYRWNSKRYESLSRIWHKQTGFDASGSRAVLTQPEKEWLKRIDERMREKGGDLDAAISAMCYDLGDDAKSAISFLPRDTAAAMLKEVLLRLKWLADDGIMLLSNHDAILCEVEEAKLDWVANLLKTEMETPVPQLPLDDGSGCLSIETEVKWGRTWDSADDEDEGSMRVYEFPQKEEKAAKIVLAAI